MVVKITSLANIEILAFEPKIFNFLTKRTAPLNPPTFQLSESCPRALLANFKMDLRPGGQNQHPKLPYLLKSRNPTSDRDRDF